MGTHFSNFFPFTCQSANSRASSETSSLFLSAVEGLLLGQPAAWVLPIPNHRKWSPSQVSMSYVDGIFSTSWHLFFLILKNLFAVQFSSGSPMKPGQNHWFPGSCWDSAVGASFHQRGNDSVAMLVCLFIVFFGRVIWTFSPVCWHCALYGPLWLFWSPDLKKHAWNLLASTPL